MACCELCEEMTGVGTVQERRRGQGLGLEDGGAPVLGAIGPWCPPFFQKAQCGIRVQSCPRFGNCLY